MVGWNGLGQDGMKGGGGWWDGAGWGEMEWDGTAWVRVGCVG